MDQRPARTVNPFFGVGPISDVIADEAEARRNRFAFDRWLEDTYRKRAADGRDLGPFTTSEIGRSMHRGTPADEILTDMMHHIHRYFGFPDQNKIAVGLGGGHSGFTVALMHLMSPKAGPVFVDTPRPESASASEGGFFRQSWGTQVLELMKHAGAAENVQFADSEGSVPADLTERDVSLFVGVGHETTGATTYTQEEVERLLEWLAGDPKNRHAMVDVTSLLGAMTWTEDVVQKFMAQCCLFTPFQKAIGGVSGYFLASFTPEAMALISANMADPSWAIPRQLKLSVPTDAKRPLSGESSVGLGPFYDPAAGKMTGGVINTYSALAFAETTYGLLRVERLVGSVGAMNRRSAANRATVDRWLAGQSLLKPGVQRPEKRGAAVTLLRVDDPEITDPEGHAQIIALSKDLLGYAGLADEPGLDAARYVNAFPGTPGDYRAWIGGIRDEEDIIRLLENITYAYGRAKDQVLRRAAAAESTDADAAAGATRILIADLVGLKFGADGAPDASAVKAHIEYQGGTWTDGPWDGDELPAGEHFFYQPDLSTASELTEACGAGQYHAVIAAATFFPVDIPFPEGGVRIGAGTGNMACACWGGGNGGGKAPLMNTPSFNSRATAQMVMKALLCVMPDIDVVEMHKRVVEGSFDTGKHLKDFPTEKLEGKRLGVIGYGNIGREVAKLGQAFGMHVTIHARERHKDFIVSEGFDYAATPAEAAKGADVLSPHTGLGPNVDGRFANEGLVGGEVLSGLNEGAVLVNYDRGEVVDAQALHEAMAAGRVSYAAIDADLFVGDDGSLSGPMVPYRPLADAFPGRLELLPHAAADTEHTSRVEGAKQAVDQILSAIRERIVINGKGDTPEGYTNGGAMTVPGVGASSAISVARADAKAMRDLAEELAAIWGAIDATQDETRRAELIQQHGRALTLASNRLSRALDTKGLTGGWS